MKILVCLTKTPDTTAKIAFKNGNTQFEESGVQWIINPYDEWYALVRAIELKEKDASTVIHLITVGAADAEVVDRVSACRSLCPARTRARMLLTTLSRASS